MPAVPAFMLKKLFVKGSLRNNLEGFEFQLKNVLAPGTITGVLPLVVDDQTYCADNLYIIQSEEQRAANQIGKEQPFSFALNSQVTMAVRGPQLKPGSHRIVIDVITKEAGELKWDVTETL